LIEHCALETYFVLNAVTRSSPGAG
jgi:hypothetical protein